MSLAKDFRIFLTNPPLNMAETPLQYHRPLIPLGLAYLGAMVENEVSNSAWEQYVQARLRECSPRGYRPTGCVAALDNMHLSFYGKYTFCNLVEKIANHSIGCRPDRLFICLSVLSDGMWAAKSMLADFRRRFPLATIVVGGPHATFFPLDFYTDPVRREGPLVDYVVRNEGELALLGIIAGDLASKEALATNGHRYGIRLEACDYSDPEYRIIDGGQYGPALLTITPHTLDSLPVPAYFLFEDSDGMLPYEPDHRYGLQSPAGNINSSRGCPHKCTFCTIPKLAPGYRTLSPARILEIVRFLALDYNVNSIFFREDNFLYAGGSVEGDRWRDIQELCDLLVDAQLKIRWAIEARADNLMQSTGQGLDRIDVLQKAGLTGVYMGVESGSDTVLKLYAKGADVATMAAGIDACHKRGVAVVATACYSDPDLLLRGRYGLIRPSDSTYQRTLVEQREAILSETRAFMNQNDIPQKLREEYVMVGIPISTVYNNIDRDRHEYPWLVEHVDQATKYIYPKGFRWWATKVYDIRRRVRPYIDYSYRPQET